MDKEHLANDMYVSRMPSPPRIQLLEPFATADRSVQALPNLPHPEFLSAVSLSGCLAPPERGAIDWRYEFRYAAQKILPFIYLGPIVAIRNTNFLVDAGISMIINVRHGRPSAAKPLNAALSDARNSGIEISVMDVHTNQSLISALPSAIQRINTHMSERNAGACPSSIDQISGSILVCCDSGNERSAAVVIAYMMETLGLGLLEAHRVVQDHRFSVSINDSMKHTLRSYEDILKARRDVGQGQVTVGSLSNDNVQPGDPATLNTLRPAAGAVKRLREADSDDDMDDSDDVARFEGRGFTPFQD